jgi:hypothetical protein
LAFFFYGNINNNSEWHAGNNKFTGNAKASTPKDVSTNMPKEFNSGVDYLHGEDYRFD